MCNRIPRTAGALAPINCILRLGDIGPRGTEGSHNRNKSREQKAAREQSGDRAEVGGNGYGGGEPAEGD